MDNSNTSQTAQVNRKVAIELAISEIAAYKQSQRSDGYTINLVRSADVILNYIEKGEVPDR